LRLTPKGSALSAPGTSVSNEIDHARSPRQDLAELARITRLLTLDEPAASITHEAREPLAAIALHGEACLRWLDQDEPQLDRARASLASIVRIALHSRDLVQRLRGLSSKAEGRDMAPAANALITMRSSYGPEDTMNRFEAQVRARGMTVFAHIDHAAGATASGLSLRPTELLIFGSAKAGTPLVQSDQTVGIDLPLKALVWQDASGDTWLSYIDPRWLAHRYALGDEVDATVSAMAETLGAVTNAATATQAA
jgi:uncharacterized protein (DUF302 family)